MNQGFFSGTNVRREEFPCSPDFRPPRLVLCSHLAESVTRKRGGTRGRGEVCTELRLADVLEFSVGEKGRNPQFNKNFLEPALVAENIAYVHCPELGGKPNGSSEPGVFARLKTREGQR